MLSRIWALPCLTHEDFSLGCVCAAEEEEEEIHYVPTASKGL